MMSLVWYKEISDGKIIRIEAIACVRKYLIIISVEVGFNLIRSRGIILIKLISSPTHAMNHEEEEHAIKVPENKLRKNRGWENLIKIKKRKVNIFIKEV